MGLKKANSQDDSQLPLLPSGSTAPSSLPKPVASLNQNQTVASTPAPTQATQARGPLPEPKPTSVVPKVSSANPPEKPSDVLVQDIHKISQGTRTVRKTPKTIGAYEILEEINRGGMGIVYKAYDTNLRRHVAIKVLLAGEGATEEDVKRFQREAQATARLQHSNIVPIYAVGNHEGKPYFVMDFIDGKTAKQLKEEGLITPRLALSIIEGVADALHHAHLSGVIHRDVKPGNILVDKFQRAQLMDFGLARRVDEDLSITQAGTTMGTPSYMSPEQAEGNLTQVDAQSDLYSAGACMYELLTGRPPFDGSTIMSILRKVVDDQPIPPRQLNPRIHRDVEIICLKCLEKEKSQRYANCKDLADDIRRFGTGESIAAKPLGFIPSLWRRAMRHKEIAIASAVVLVVTLGALGYVVLNSRQVAYKQQQELRKSLEDALLKGRTVLKEAGDLVEQLSGTARINLISDSERAQEAINNSVVAFRQVEGLISDNAEAKKAFEAIRKLQTVLEVNGFVFQAKAFLNPIPEGPDGKVDLPNFSGAEFAAREALKRQHDNEEARQLLNKAIGVRSVQIESSGPAVEVYARRILDHTLQPVSKLAAGEPDEKGTLLGTAPIQSKELDPGLYIISFVGKNSALQQLTLWVSRESREEDLHLKINIKAGGEQNMALIAEGTVKLPQMGPKKVPAFLIDRYEFPNHPGGMPESGFTPLEIRAKAQQKCRAVGKQVCTPDQWLRACMGDGDLLYPYGGNYVPSTCATGYVSETQKHPFISGFFAKCHTSEGVYDMSGNVAEWTDTNQTETLYGGDYTSLTGVPNLTVSCRARLLTAEGNPERVGFRCCKAVK